MRFTIQKITAFVSSKKQKLDVQLVLLHLLLQNFRQLSYNVQISTGIDRRQWTLVRSEGEELDFSLKVKKMWFLYFSEKIFGHPRSKIVIQH